MNEGKQQWGEDVNRGERGREGKTTIGRGRKGYRRGPSAGGLTGWDQRRQWGGGESEQGGRGKGEL